MNMVLFMVVGFLFSPNSEDCTKVLHQLRTDHNLKIESTVAINDTVVYTLTDRFGFKKKTAQVHCQLPPG